MNNLRLIWRCAEFLEQSEVGKVPYPTRGIYVLLLKTKSSKFDVVYIGMSKRSILTRLREHKRNPKKAGLWTHFSVYAVWPNIADSEIEELEGLFRAIYRKDSKTNSIAVQKGFRKLRNVRDNAFLKKWKME